MIKEAILYDAFLMTQLKGMLLVLVFFLFLFRFVCKFIIHLLLFFPSSSNLINFGPSVCSRWMNDKAINNFHRPYQRCVIIKKNKIEFTLFFVGTWQKKINDCQKFQCQIRSGQKKSFGKSTRVNIFLPFFWKKKLTNWIPTIIYQSRTM